ncbi:unnamed protein product [Nippostrongylus brasiliensis]|uniref:BTP domain-containing protein n=1 Tax=Nippostrongylus brasiliensis TaxID=27835 RepID=A0A158QWW5_NIPBR|nr:unnamed protein product [Nippostrongylus brasiliensis]
MGSWPSPEEVALQGLRSATGHILENIGFSSVSSDSLNALTDVMRRFMIELWSRSKLFAEHAGRTQICPEDMNLTFRKIKFSPLEMRDYLLQVGNVGQPKPMCQFPIAHPNVRPLFAPQPSTKELEDRPEHIPPYYPAVHPEWTTEGKLYGAVDFPDFSNCDAKSLGLLPRGHQEPSFLDTSKDHSSATGIRSSANLSSLKLQQSDNDEFSASISSPRKKIKGTASYKDLHSNYSPSPTPSPLPSHLLKRTEQSTSRAESPSPRIQIPRKNEQKQPKAQYSKIKKSAFAEHSTPNTSPMPKLEYQNTPEAVQVLPEVHSARASPVVNLFVPQVKEEVKKSKKPKEKTSKPKEKKKKTPMSVKEPEKVKEPVVQEVKLERDQLEQQRAEEKARLHLLELARDIATPPMRQEVPEG